MDKKVDNYNFMQIHQVKISELKPAEYNPRKWDKKAINNLKRGIEKFGIVDPIIVNGSDERKNIIIGGHFRLAVLKEMGFTEVPVIYVNVPDIEKEKELNLRLNKNLGEWDETLLKNFNEEMLLDIGWKKDELDLLFEKGVEEDNFDAQKEYDSITTPKAQLGDIYKLGRHRIMCGDSAKKEDATKLMNGQKGRLIFTDPPYNVDYKSPAGLDYASTKFGGTGGKIFNDNKTDEDAQQFYTDVLNNLSEVTTDDASIYWWFANKNDWINREAFLNAHWHRSQIIIWVKNSMIYSHCQDYHRQYEPCMFGWKKSKKHYTNKGIANFKDVFSLDYDSCKEAIEGMIDIWYQKRDATVSYVHPTQKPIKLAERGLKKNSQQGDIVLDFFLGSGSTLMACEQMNRICFGMELDPKYVDVEITRWETFTGQKAEKQI